MGSGTDLLLDWGNTRLKWALARDGVIQAMQQLLPAPPLSECFARVWSELSAPQRVVCVSVTDQARLQELAAFVDHQWGCVMQVAQSQAQAGRLVNAYAAPNQMGADRWIAMLGAATRCSGAFAVIDAGTALTVDVVDAEGQHLGGWIIPGRALMNQALTRHTENLRGRLIDSGAALGQDTSACIAGGVSAAQLGALELMKQRLPDHCQIFICGGDGEWVGQYVEEADCQPNLVLQGLAAWLNYHEISGKN